MQAAALLLAVLASAYAIDVVPTLNTTAYIGRWYQVSFGALLCSLSACVFLKLSSPLLWASLTRSFFRLTFLCRCMPTCSSMIPLSATPSAPRRTMREFLLRSGLPVCSIGGTEPFARLLDAHPPLCSVYSANNLSVFNAENLKTPGGKQSVINGCDQCL
jgi:hypothetical protein